MKTPSSFSTISKRLHYGAHLRPVRDWFVLLIIFVLFLLVSLAWNLWLFSQVTQGQQIGTASSTPDTQIPLDSVTTLFDSRAQERAHYQHDYRFVDPSL
jgi:hypothetical protein